MPEPALMIWILCAPLLLGVVELLRTVALIRKTPNAERSGWSSQLGVSGAKGATSPAAAATVRR